MRSPNGNSPLRHVVHDIVYRLGREAPKRGAQPGDRAIAFAFPGLLRRCIRGPIPLGLLLLA